MLKLIFLKIYIYIYIYELIYIIMEKYFFIFL